MYDVCIFAAVPYEKQYAAAKSWGCYRAAAEIRQHGMTCQVINYYNRFSYDDLINIMIKFISNKTKAVGFSTSFLEHYKQDDKQITIDKTSFIINWVRTNFPDIKIICGGNSTKELQNLDIDKSFKGFSEQSFISYLTGSFIKFDFNKSTTTYIFNDLITENDSPILEVGRGCIFSCKFCGFELNGKHKFDYLKDPEILRHELIHNYENWGITHYMLSDDTFNDSTFKVEQLHKIFVSLPFKIKFNCYLRLDLLNAHPEQIPLLKEMGLIGTFFGVETFHEKSARLIGKGLNPKKSKKLLHDLKHKYWGDQIKIGIGLIVGIPYDTYDNVYRTIDWIHDPTNKVDQVSTHPLFVKNPIYDNSLVNDSEFRKNPEKYGFSWPDGSLLNWKNSFSEIDTFNKAVDLHIEVNKAVTETSRWRGGGFNFLKNYTLTQYVDNKLTTDELLSLDRFQYTKYLNDYITEEIEQKCVNHYKERLLKL